MKQISFSAVCMLLMLSLLSCTGFNHNTNITVSESDQYFTIRTHYNQGRQYEVNKCMNKHFGKASNMSFANTQVKGNIAMDNGTRFYIEKKPGFLDVKFNKNENSVSAYKELKAFSSDLKDAIQ